MNNIQILTRNEMKKILGGSMGCAPSCSGCIENGASGPDQCYTWTCTDEELGFCAPIASTCCIVT